ncbi:hypothetical protein V5799_017876 [Amblyomma americanum]|uniref:Secreted protein n=1 Tax=Amblyomma americanum TaxID=6943 RepID=A0AAQ4F1Z2_AMBAM
MPYLNRNLHLPILVIMLTITTIDPRRTRPQATASWDTSCLADQGQARLNAMVRAIGNITAPSLARFALTLSLRMDVFENVNITSVSQSLSRLTIPAARRRLIQKFSMKCWNGVYRNDPQGSRFIYLSGDTCLFASYDDGTIRGISAFETARSVESKMQKARRTLAYLDPNNTHQLAWLAHDVTFNLAGSNCGGDSSRLKRMHDLV